MSSIHHAERRTLSRAWACLALIAAPVALLFSNTTGMLVTHFNVTQEVAATILGLIASGGEEVLALFFPLIIPFEVTISAIVATAGTAAAITW